MYFLAALRLIQREPLLCGHLFPSIGRFIPKKSRLLPGLVIDGRNCSLPAAFTFDGIDVTRNIDSQKNPVKNPLWFFITHSFFRGEKSGILSHDENGFPLVSYDVCLGAIAPNLEMELNVVVVEFHFIQIDHTT